ncbi:MAG: DUF4474 domain-containing protein [Spirochaetales bacterium]|nr:DUF4474 domain-containing protein [Spirochaetales bacterium]
MAKSEEAPVPGQWAAKSDIAKLVETAGFLYDPEQDIIYSRIDALQKDFGYSLLYDDLAPVMIGAVIDCEPVYFDYGGDSWMIELWKVQYGIETGAEIGVYYVKREEKVALYNRLKSDLGLADNDPNNFAVSEIEDKKLGGEYSEVTGYLGTAADRIERLTGLWNSLKG